MRGCRRLIFADLLTFRRNRVVIYATKLFLLDPPLLQHEGNFVKTQATG